MEVLKKIPFALDLDALLSKVRVDKDSEDAADLRALADVAVRAARPKAIYKLAYVRDEGEDRIAVDAAVFTSRVLRANLDGVERVFPYVCTCGAELDEAALPAGGGLLTEFWFDTIKEMALRAASGFLRKHLKEQFAVEKMSSMNPGSGPHDTWPIEQQKELFSIFGDVENAIGVRLTDSCLMIPNKSHSGILFPTEISFETCRLCPRSGCPSRRAAYDHVTAESWRRRPAANTET